MNIKTVGLQVVPEQMSTIQTSLDDASEFLTERIGDFDELSLTLKEIHGGKEGHPVYHVTVNVVKGTVIAHCVEEDRNVLKAVDAAIDTVKETASKK